MTPRAVALSLLPYIGVYSLDPADNDISLLQRGVTPDDLSTIARCINGALQEMFDEGPSWLSERPDGGVLRPPATATINVTQYSKACSVPGFESWMLGCTFRISGDPLDNRLVSQTALARPYMGTSGTGTSATVYCDAIPMDASVRSVLDPIELPNNARLHVANSAEEFRVFNGTDIFNGASRHPFAPSTNYSLSNKSVGEPVVAFLDTAFVENSENMQIFLRFNPMPGQAYPVSCRTKMKPPEITPAHIDNGDHTTDPLKKIPVDYHESVLFPIVLKRWTGHPNFKADERVLAEINRQYAVAIKNLKGTRPGVSRTHGIYSQG